MMTSRTLYVLRAYTYVPLIFNLLSLGSTTSKQHMYVHWPDIQQDIEGSSLKHSLKFPIATWPRGVMENHSNLQVR